MKLEDKNAQKESPKNRFFTEIPQDKATETIPPMRAVIIADIEELEDVESLSNRP
ncbi:Uncharacterised protein [Legionella lansingensis]|uniref:Uncharacterized protein n=1 Tax=Legionella lansingensis TaxID=45067 RepID=A0A0W0VHI6_9GAMM|nr:hypothetical protein [Legionella lansingensis]KTD19608.1 hypothetical protein Llan_2070 [Legionella lansingensis]SNV50217.1 Uncharacterised protein [Legionella lansingensis]